MTGPLLLDEIVAHGPARAGGRVPHGIWTQVVNARINAQRFLFDDAASAIAGEFAIGCPDLILNNRQFAIPPYHATYVEVASKPFFATAKHPDSVKLDTRLGYLALGPFVYPVFSRADTAAVLSYWRYQVVPPGQIAQQDTLRIRGSLRDFDHEEISPEHKTELMANMGKLAVLLGGALNLESGDITDGAYIRTGNIPAYLAIARECSIQWLAPDTPMAQQAVPLMKAKGFFGDVRNFWALMLWLNQPSRTRFITVPGGRKIVRGKPTPYLSHNVVTITLGRARTVRRAYELAVERRSPKGHDVRGHFRHRGGYSHCRGGEGHAWPLEPGPNHVWVCPRCGKERWHVKDHRRGDAAKGIVIKHYEITGEDNHA